MNETEIERLVVRIVGDMSQYQRTLNQASQATQSSVSSMLTSLAALTAGYLSLSAIVGAIKWGGQLAAEAEQSQIAFEVMLGSAAKAKDMLAQMRQFADATPLGNADIQSAGKTLLQFGVAGQNVMPILKMLGDVTGGDTNKFAHLSLAFGQMTSAGRLMGQDLLQMVNVGFNPLQTMAERAAKQLGGIASDHMPRLKKEMEAGRISVAMVVQAFQDATREGGTFAGMMEKQSKSLSGLWNTLKDSVGSVMMKISKSLMDGFDLKGVYSKLIEFFGTFSANYEANMKALSDWTKSIWSGITAWVQQEFGFVIDYAVQAWDYITAATSQFVTNVLGFFSHFRENLAIMWEWLGKNWQNLLVDMINMIGVFTSNIIQNAMVGVRTYVRLYTAFAGWFVGLFKRIFSFEVVDAILTGLIKAGEKIREWASAAWQSIKAIFTGKKAPGALDAFIEQVKGDFAKGMENGDLLGTFKDILVEEGKNIKNPLEGFESTITEGPKLNLTPDGSDLPAFVWKTGNDAKKGFSDAITGLGDPMVKEAAKAKGAMKSLDAVAFDSAEAVARVMEFKMSRLQGVIKKGATGAAVMPIRQSGSPTAIANAGAGGRAGGGGDTRILDYLRIIAENTSTLKEREMNKPTAGTIQGVDFTAANIGEDVA